MFGITFKTSLKTLLRSSLFWCAFSLVLFVVMNEAMGETVRITLLDDTGNITGYITDLDSEYILTYKTYIQTILNCSKAWIMSYAMPIFSVISTMIILNRDYGDGFFEVEKSSGMKSISYTLGRLTAILLVNVIVYLLATCFSFNYFYFSRGCLENFDFIHYLCDSTTRILRVFSCAAILGIAFFVVLTYTVGNLCRSRFMGVVIGIAYVMFEFVSKTTLRSRLPDLYHKYITVKPDYLYQYWTFYDTEWFSEKLIHNPFTKLQMQMCVGIILTNIVVCVILTYTSIKKRNI